jgi:hypothetical protein
LVLASDEDNDDSSVEEEEKRLLLLLLLLLLLSFLLLLLLLFLVVRIKLALESSSRKMGKEDIRNINGLLKEKRANYQFEDPVRLCLVSWKCFPQRERRRKHQ